METLPQNETTLDFQGEITQLHCLPKQHTNMNLSDQELHSRQKRKRRRPSKSFRNWQLDRTALVALCCLWLVQIPASQTPGMVVEAVTSAATSSDARYRHYHLRRLQGQSQARSEATVPFRHLQQQQQQQQQPQIPPLSLLQVTDDHNNRSSTMQPYLSLGDRTTAISSLLKRDGYNTAFGTEPLCWRSVNQTNDNNENAFNSHIWNTTGMLDSDILFPNPLVDDFAYRPGEEELLPTCFQNSGISVTKPQEALDGERLRTFEEYEFQVDLKLDFTELLISEIYGDAILTSTPNVSQVALQVMHCVLGKSGVCIPFLHEQAYTLDYIEQQQKPNASIPGTIHGETHVHTDFVLVEIPYGQTFLERSVSIPAQVHVEGEYFVLAAVQFYTGDSKTNIAYYRFDMANAMAPDMRVVTYQHKADIQEVSRQVRLLSYTFIALASVIILFLIYQTIKHREEQVLKLSQGEFLVVFLLSALTATVSTFLMEPKNDLYCNLGSTLVLLPVQLMYAITAGRLWRINAVISPLLVEHMRKKTKWTNRFVGAVDALSSSLTLGLRGQKSREIRRSIPKWQLGVVVGMFVAPQVFLQMSELIWQPQQREIDYNDDESVGRAMCGIGSDTVGNSLLLYSFLALLLLIVVVLCVAYSSRKLPSLFNETQVIYDSTFISVILIFFGAGIVALTSQPTTSPDVSYMVWVVVTLSITLNASLRIMSPKLKMIWKGEQVIVSKLVSDHHRKRREKDLQHLRDDPDIMRNVTGVDDDFNTSFYNRSFGASRLSLNYTGQSTGSLNWQQDDAPHHSLLSNSNSSQRTPKLYPELSLGDLTTKMSNIDENFEGKEQPAASDEDAREAIEEEGSHGSPPCELPGTEAKYPKGVAPPDVEESMDFAELTWKRMPSNRAQTPEVKPPPSPGSKDPSESKNDTAAESDTETVNSHKRGRRRRWSPLRKKSDSPKRSSEPLMHPEPQNDTAAESDTETVNSNKGGRRRRWSPLRKKRDSENQPKRSSAPQMDTSEANKVTDGLSKSDDDDKSTKSGRRRRWSPRRKNSGEKAQGGEAKARRQTDPAKLSSDAKNIAFSAAGDSEDDTVNSKKPINRRRRWSPLVKDMPHSDGTVKHQEEKAKASGTRLSIPNLQVMSNLRTMPQLPVMPNLPAMPHLPAMPNFAQFNPLAIGTLIGKSDSENAEGVSNDVTPHTRGRRRSAMTISNRKRSPTRRFQREMSAPRLGGGRSGKSGRSSRFRPKQPERLKVAPDETPARRLVLKMIDLQEQLTTVNRKIISGLVVSPEEWDLLTTLNEKLHKTFEKDVDFSWREVTETPPQIPTLAAPTGPSNASNDSHQTPNLNNHNDKGSATGSGAQRPPAQIAINTANQSPPHSPKRGKPVLQRGTVTNPTELAKNFRKMIDVRDRRKAIMWHKSCFVGKDAVDALIYSGMATTRDEAVLMGRAMVLDMHLFKTVDGEFEFDDDDNFYRFVDLEDFWSSSEEEDDEDSVGVFPSIMEEPDVELTALAFREAVLVGDHTYRMQTFKSVFIGAEAVDSLVYAGVAATRWEAVQLGRKLAREQRLFKHVSDSYDFRDDFLFYRFCGSDDTEFKSTDFDFTVNSNTEGSHSFTSPSESRNDLADKADAFRMYVDVRNRKYRLQAMKNVFVGSEAVDSLVFAGVSTTRLEAVELGRTLIKDLRLFSSVRGDENFSDNSHSFYRFQDKHLRRRSISTDVPSVKSKNTDEGMLNELKGIADAFQSMVEVKDRRYRFRTYKNCFVGAEAVDMMLSSGMAESRVEAVQLGRALARQLRIFKHVSVDKQFSDEYTFYRLTDPDHSFGSAQSETNREMQISRRSQAPRHIVATVGDAQSLFLLDSSSTIADDSFAQNSHALSSSLRSTETPLNDLHLQHLFNSSIRSSGTSTQDHLLNSSLRSSGTRDRFGTSGSSELDSNNASYLEMVPELGESRSGDFEA